MASAMNPEPRPIASSAIRYRKYAAIAIPIKLGTRSANSRKGPAGKQKKLAMIEYSSDCPGQCNVFCSAARGPSCAIHHVPASSTQKLLRSLGPQIRQTHSPNTIHSAVTRLTSRLDSDFSNDCRLLFSVPLTDDIIWTSPSELPPSATYGGTRSLLS